MIEVDRNEDNRGWFMTLFRNPRSGSEASGFPQIRQVNCSSSYASGTVRGFHGQLGEHGDPKCLFVLSGAIRDVCLILNRSKNKATKFEYTMDAYSSDLLFIPRFALHGFQTLESDTKIMYLHFADYRKDLEVRYNPLIGNLAGLWPIEVQALARSDAEAKKCDFEIE